MRRKKYKILPTGEILALRSFGEAQSGDLGGVVESEANLSHRGDCWVFPGAKVSGPFTVWGSAKIVEGVYNQEAIVYQGVIKSLDDLAGNTIKIV